MTVCYTRSESIAQQIQRECNGMSHLSDAHSHQTQLK